MKKKRSDLVMTMFRDHLLRADGVVGNLPKMPNGILPWIPDTSCFGPDEGFDNFSKKVDILGQVIQEFIGLDQATDLEIVIFRVNFNIDTPSIYEAQCVRDEIFERLKQYVVKRRVPGSRGWRLGAVRRGCLHYNEGGCTYTYSTDIVLSNKVWYNNDQVKVVEFDAEEFIQLQKTAFTARDLTGFKVPLRVKVTKFLDLKSGVNTNKKLSSAFA